ncbi:hypothetical protein PHYPSEUDO_006819 [Phytophthora pseudosyringae]|uniref:Uncharacterized protein n=1 Tax=Phytophthora pseudosyringae TaxID=221518 RepID=A0A8T1VHR4_9STRA|nr:hypothetical protein PHYPSEUDO_006819 [Phytophthora pseudosyringae]
MVGSADAHGRLQIVLATLGNFCLICRSCSGAWYELLVRMAGRTSQIPCILMTDRCLGVANTLFLIVGSIPVLPDIKSCCAWPIDSFAKSNIPPHASHVTDITAFGMLPRKLG